MSLCISSIYSRVALVFLLFFSLFSYPQNNDSLNSVLRVGEISVSGNKITKKNIITRELTFNTGDTLAVKYLQEAILRSQQNIFNTQLFIYDSIRATIVGETVNFDIRVKERWYIIPAPIFQCRAGRGPVGGGRVVSALNSVGSNTRLSICRIDCGLVLL